MSKHPGEGVRFSYRNCECIGYIFQYNGLITRLQSKKKATQPPSNSPNPLGKNNIVLEMNQTVPRISPHIQPPRQG